MAREEFIKAIESIAPEKLVYVDESGVDNNITVEYGWSEKGKRSYAEKLGFASDRRNIIAGYNYATKDIIAPFEYKGYTDKLLFVSWFKNVLCPNLTPGQVVILDNASFHKVDELYNIIEECGCKLIYLPPYSPDLNPIENFWANFKRNLRKVIKKFGNFLEAITYAINITLPC